MLAQLNHLEKSFENREDMIFSYRSTREEIAVFEIKFLHKALVNAALDLLRDLIELGMKDDAEAIAKEAGRK